jgi:hypothetical protein
MNSGSYFRGAEWFTPSPALFTRIDAIAAKPEAVGLPRTFSFLATRDNVQA